MNPHGDIVAISLPTDSSFDPAAQAYETTEYGQDRQGEQRRYQYLGRYQRHNDTLTGITLMGARLYNSTPGRFTSVDSVEGGAANDYEYVGGDPVNSIDLTGQWLCKIRLKSITTKGGNYAEICVINSRPKDTAAGKIRIGFRYAIKNVSHRAGLDFLHVRACNSDLSRCNSREPTPEELASGKHIAKTSVPLSRGEYFTVVGSMTWSAATIYGWEMVHGDGYAPTAV